MDDIYKLCIILVDSIILSSVVKPGFGRIQSYN